MLKQRVPCNLVIALWAVTEIRASTANAEPQCLRVTRLGFNVFIFIYLFHPVLERKANLVCCIAANFVCTRDALNILISWVPVRKTDIACQSMVGRGGSESRVVSRGLKAPEFLEKNWYCPQNTVQTQKLANRTSEHGPVPHVGTFSWPPLCRILFTHPFYRQEIRIN